MNRSINLCSLLLIFISRGGTPLPRGVALIRQAANFASVAADNASLPHGTVQRATVELCYCACCIFIGQKTTKFVSKTWLAH